MQVLLSASGTRGDIEPALGLALRLREFGVGVRVCAPPNFAPRFTELGVPLVPLGPPIPGSDGERATRAELLVYMAEWPAAQFDTISAAAVGCDVVVSTGITEIAGRSAAERLGIHYRYASYQPTGLPSPHHAPMPRMAGELPPPAGIGNPTLWEIDAQGWNAQFGAALDAHRAALGLPAVRNVRDHVIADRPLLAADPVLGPWPGSPDLEVVQTGAWIVPDARPLPGELTAFLDAGTPPVYIGFGSMRVRDGVARVAIDAVRAHGRRVLLSRGWARLAAIDDRCDCLVVGEVNHQALFPRLAAVVHHGGAGTTTIAARAGVPQVVIPQMTDQGYWARRVAELGIGASLPENADPDPELSSAAVGTALAAGTRARAGEVAGTVGTDGAAVAATLLIDSIG
ncbi:glycosyltransferase [Nocardia sp. alder85J]|uniref:glycosyltransferase n=1 Tax=Nocardia sp. alder85J TaxID=2862949 RepID=UPI001CD210BE|nr:glycosyltransferase [Nocardia sp. alder85J]MCX4094760.1 glycosyltransferase [Nocardia sp. alder85J]